MADPRIDRIVVVIPARDEQDTIVAALAAVRVAAAQVAPRPVELLVVANGCLDRTAQRAEAAGALVLVSEIANVGAARARGVAHALRSEQDLARTWIATSDADSIVPPGWLQAQVEAAAAGADLFLGTIELGPLEVDRHRAWFDHYVSRRFLDGHGHVHGASLGVRASAYESVGGFALMGVHEDVDLVNRLLAQGYQPAWVDHEPVMTSARHGARVVGGVGSDLAASAPDV